MQEDNLLTEDNIAKAMAAFKKFNATAKKAAHAINKARKGKVVKPGPSLDMVHDANDILLRLALANKDKRLKAITNKIRGLLDKAEIHSDKWYSDVYTEEFMEAEIILAEALTAKQRMAKKMAMKKNKAKIKIAKKKNAKRLKNPDKLKKSAMKKARDIVAKKMMKGKDKKDMSYAQRNALEKRLDKKKGAIKKLAKKIKPKVKMADKERVARARASKK